MQVKSLSCIECKFFFYLLFKEIKYDISQEKWGRLKKYYYWLLVEIFFMLCIIKSIYYEKSDICSFVNLLILYLSVFY